MRFSNLFCPTLKENPAEAETPSHQLMLRAGMIRQVAAGIYDVLPVGLRVIRKVEKLVREEMNRAGAQEVYLPAIQPAELWKESGRWELLGKEMLRFKDRNDRDFCFGPTHEEVITDLMRREVRSYRDLPKNLYQIQVKFRDEVRPRFGLMRGREFMMKDAYSFDVDDAQGSESYRKMSEAYTRIFSRAKLDYTVADADPGNIGGSLSQEFMVLAASGEDQIIRCTKCGYAANAEKAVGKVPPPKKAKLPAKLERWPTPGKKSAAEQAAVMGVPLSSVIKTLIYKTESEFVAVLVPGDREVNDIQLKRYLNATHLGLASQAEVLKLTGGPAGFCGPIGLPTGKDRIRRLVSDDLVQEGEKYVVGANEEGLHLAGAVAGKDFPLGDRVTIRKANAGDLCTKCGQELRSDRGIEVGHIFKLGTKYSLAMSAMFADKDGAMKPFYMGCYGIGIGRTAAAAIEQNHDEHGIIFPPPLAPFDVAVVPVDPAEGKLRTLAEKTYEDLKRENFDPLLDDRDAPVGKRFKDMDLIGIPARVTVGEKAVAQGKLEVKGRRENKGVFIDPSQLTKWLTDVLQ